MATTNPDETDGIDEAGLEVAHRKTSSVGLPAVTSAMQHALREMGPVRTARTLLTINQTDGFDCMSCAWPDPEAGQRSHAEFCENARRRWRSRRPASACGASSSPSTRSTSCSPGTTTGSAARAASRPPCCAPRVTPTTDPRPGTTPSRSSPARCAGSTRRTRRRSTPRAGRRTRPRSSTSSSCAGWGRTTCRTAPPSATSRPARPWGTASGSARARSPCTTWAALEGDYRLIRLHIEAVVPGFVDYERRIDRPGGFRLPHGPHDVRTFTTASTTAHFVSSELWWPRVPSGRLLLQTLRSHDQFNTTIYGPDDRYRGISGGRRVVMVNPADLAELGFADGDLVDLVSELAGDADRHAEGFRVVADDTARGCAASYFPETNVLVPLDSTADRSNTPTSKSVVIRLEPAQG